MNNLHEAVQYKNITLVYDKQCPACERFAQLVRIRESIGELKLLNARDGGEIIEKISERGWDLDEGMVLKLDQQLYYDGDAIQMLALLSSRSGLFNRLNYWVFKSAGRAKLLYPLLKMGRNLLLKILGKRKINNLNLPDNNRF